VANIKAIRGQRPGADHRDRTMLDVFEV